MMPGAAGRGRISRGNRGQSSGEIDNAAYVLVGLGGTALRQGDLATAGAHLAECLGIAREYGDETLVADMLESLAGLAAAEARPERAARLAGAAAALRATIGAPRGPAAVVRLEQELALARQALDAERYAAAWAEGQAMPVEQAVAYALDEAPDAPDAPDAA
jgi:hypothetical protein